VFGIVTQAIDLIRQILLDLEARGAYTNWLDIDFEAYSPEQMDYHLDLLVEAGLIAVRTSERERSRWLSVRLTWAGHEFLDAARDEQRWRSIQDAVSRAGGAPFEIVQSALTAAARREIGVDRPAA